jgi:hypothetical protein
MVHRDSFFVDRRIAALIITLLAFAVLAVPALAVQNDITPSTNDINRTNGWAHVNQLSMDIGETDLEFVSTKSWLSCFEYRTDGDTSQAISDTNFNTAVTDGLYPYFCLSNTTRTETIEAMHYVEVRMVFGGEGDERFDWTRFDVINPSTKEDCADGGWETYEFANQGQCNRFVNGGGDSRP